MGQEWSWPCASRDAQEKKLNESKYDFGFLEQQTGELTEDPRGSSKMQKIAKIEKIITNREYTSRMSTTPSPSVAGTPYSFTDDSLNEEDMNVIVVCEEIDEFDSFMTKYTKKYKNKMFPTCIIPHPFQRKAVVVFQSGSTNPFLMAQHDSSKFIEIAKDLKNLENKDAYTVLIKFFRLQAEMGYDFIGYYMDNQLTYHFVFQERPDQTQQVDLQFETLPSLGFEDLNSAFSNESNSHYKLRGVVSLVGQPRHLSFAIYEKKNLNLVQPLVVEVTQDCLGTNIISGELSRKIEIGTVYDGFELLCLVTSHEGRIVYLVWGQ